MNLRFTKEQLAEALEARRSWARQMDKKRKAKHASDEKRYMETFRAKLKAASKWDYEKAKKNLFEVSLSYAEQRQRPECPEGVEANLDKAISQVEMDGREKYVLSALPPKRYGYNDTSYIYWLLTHDETAKPDVCA